jgi:hypothetical protein
VGGEAQQLSKHEWDEYRFGNFCLTSEGFGNYQKFVRQVCTKHKCTKEEVEGYEKIFTMLNELHEESTSGGARTSEPEGSKEIDLTGDSQATWGGN